ncbi:MAG: site-specific integrase, partial [Rhodoferax sp.]|nr:site-specific integrase [Rhodoferax sp.]
MPTLPTASMEAIDGFIDSLWLEEGLSRNTLSAYRQDLTLYCQWLAERQNHLNATTEADLQAYFAHRHAETKATSANRRLSVFKR